MLVFEATSDNTRHKAVSQSLAEGYIPCYFNFLLLEFFLESLHPQGCIPIYPPLGTGTKLSQKKSKPADYLLNKQDTFCLWWNPTLLVTEDFKLYFGGVGGEGRKRCFTSGEHTEKSLFYLKAICLQNEAVQAPKTSRATNKHQ